MARPLNSPIRAQLQNARTYTEQAAALQALKNEIIGHAPKKEAWIGAGVLEPIVATLSLPPSPAQSNGTETGQKLAWRPMTDEEKVRQQALQLIASFASGGPPFLAPLHATGALPTLLNSGLSPLTNPPEIVVATLRALTDVADAAALADSSSPIDISLLADSIFVSPHIESLRLMLSMTVVQPALYSQVTLAAGLICRLCREERHRQALASAALLDSLAMQLARFVVREGLLVPGAERLASDEGICDVIPPAAPAASPIGPILEATAAILGDSKYRANQLANSPALVAAFPDVRVEQPRPSSPVQPPPVTPMDCILPSLPIHMVPSALAAQDGVEARVSSRNPLGKLGSAAISEPSEPSSGSAAGGNNGDPMSMLDVENPLFPWLMHLTRTLSGHDRLMAIAVLAALFKGCPGRVSDIRETSIGLLVVPILVGMVADIDKESADAEASPSNRLTQKPIVEKAPTILARLITDSDKLQKAAFASGAVKTLTKLLKSAYQPVPAMVIPKYWSPNPHEEEPQNPSPASQLGGRGLNPELIHNVQVRGAALGAISALAAGKEDYRKALVAEDLVPYLVESLAEWPRRPRLVKDRSKEKLSGEAARKGPLPALGANPAPVLIAACHVVRTLARSVSILRTSMVDYMIALPILEFMSHEDIGVQVAATAAAINLCVEVSPGRMVLAEKGIMGVLCEHAHSDHPELRLNALWALKHFVDAVGPDVKKECLRQLQPGWLLQLISEDPRNAAAHDPSSQTSTQDDDRDETMEMQAAPARFQWVCGKSGVVRELDASRSSSLRQAEDRLLAMREAELIGTRRACNDDVGIQEQALDFIRNMIGRPESGLSSETSGEATDMIEHVLVELGHERLFEIMQSKLRVKTVRPFLRRGSGSGHETARVLPPNPKMKKAIIYILVHIAASVTRYRQLVMQQTEMLKLLAHQANSKDKDVRVALCHLVINLTCQEEESGQGMDCAARAVELKRLGYYKKMEALRNQDRDLDVRERAKTAAWQLHNACVPNNRANS